MSVALIYAILFYLATAVFLVGLVLKVVRYAKTPAPLKIPTTPAPLTKGGAAFRVGREVVLFESLFRSNKWLWIFAVLFHLGLLLVVIRHLRYFTEPVWFWVEMLQMIGMYGGLVMVLGLVLLLARRLVLERIRYISAPNDYLMLLLLLAIGFSGAVMTFFTHTDIVAVKAFFLGLMVFDIRPLPADGPLMVHLGLVALLMIVFPFSKLLHAPGVFFSPTRNQTDTPREARHLADWAAPMDQQREA